MATITRILGEVQSTRAVLPRDVYGIYEALGVSDISELKTDTGFQVRRDDNKIVFQGSVALGMENSDIDPSKKSVALGENMEITTENTFNFGMDESKNEIDTSFVFSGNDESKAVRYMKNLVTPNLSSNNPSEVPIDIDVNLDSSNFVNIRITAIEENTIGDSSYSSWIVKSHLVNDSGSSVVKGFDIEEQALNPDLGEEDFNIEIDSSNAQILIKDERGNFDASTKKVRWSLLFEVFEINDE